ncbi:MAG TPA: sarcosine oxidase subunit gamma family protein [Beijerinckiaceae bacterium]|nr:sarcosine oxidase subunit gamma family protein [Beijerinckiaceae bacterium]
MAEIAIPGRVSVADAGPSGRLVLRGPEAIGRAAAQALGLEPPPLNRAAAADEHAMLRLGPDEWLLLAPPAASGLAHRVRQALGDAPHALVDVSQRQVAYLVTGPRAADLLAAGCPLDLDAFSVGTATRTLLGKAEIVLWRTEEAWRLEVARSFALYALAFLREAAREHKAG